MRRKARFNPQPPRRRLKRDSGYAPAENSKDTILYLKIAPHFTLEDKPVEIGDLSWVWVHEMMHHLCEYVGEEIGFDTVDMAQQRHALAVSRDLSFTDYAQKDYYEWFAETMAAYFLMPDVLRERLPEDYAACDALARTMQLKGVL